MCGIVGIVGYRDSAPAASLEELRAIRDHMSRRGPDGHGEWFSEDRRVALGHRRLAIIDLSDRALQPMQTADGQLIVTFNGEIYNHVALRKGLEARGYVFRTTSDTEVLLHLYAEHGPDMLRELRGMFAFAIWDKKKGGVLIARDPYGIKPLYYTDDGKTIRFASQVKALLAGGGVSKTLDPAGQVGFYLWGSVPEPFTMYGAIRALPAGTWLWADTRGVSDPTTYFSIGRTWALACDADKPLPSAEEAQERASDALRDTVAHHMVADVPVSAFLSAGVDSGALVGLMADAGTRDSHAVTLTFAEFVGKADDEAPLARAVAEHYGVQHHARVVDQVEFMGDLPVLLAAMDQPSIDGMNTWFVSKATAEIGLKVAISGLGGDELFGGYGSFRSVPRFVQAMRVPSYVPGLGIAMRSALSPVLRRMPRAHPKFAGMLEYGGTFPGAYFLKRGLFMPWELDALLPEDVIEAGFAQLAPLERMQALLTPDPITDFARVATLESCVYMRNQLLRDSDWASMAHSLEVRVPLVDKQLLMSIAPLLVNNPSLANKPLLASAPRRALPAAIRERRKTGFTTPIQAWMRSSEQLSTWKNIPMLAREGCPWARRLAYSVCGGFEAV